MKLQLPLASANGFQAIIPIFISSAVHYSQMKKTKPASMLFTIYHIIISFLIIPGCGSTPEGAIQKPDQKSITAIGYDLDNPDGTFILPPVLHEISGIAVFDSSSVACVQDENGIIFIYDLSKKTITQNVTFYGNGDYEDIARTAGAFYVLKSNGTLYKISDMNRPLPPEEIHLKGIPHKDIEGLCFDSKNERLLIAPKDKADKDSEAEVKQGIYGYDLKTGELIKDPLIEFKLPAIKEFAARVLEPVEYNKKGEPKKPDIRFSPSAIAIHPVTGRLYLLSADDHMLFVFSLQGKIEFIVRLKPEIYNMAEGITFFQNGDMLISNEGQNGNASLLRFRYHE
jgi:hypothetical protein